jgi:site-specific recombinase XerD
MGGERYPENHMMFAPDYHDLDVEITASETRFLDLRESVCLGYGYNTARAYWGDLDDWFRWARERGKDILELSERDAAQYYALLRRRRYSESTIRRRRTALRLLYQSASKH